MTRIRMLESVWRYPVKSMRGEQVDEIFAAFAGLMGDRIYGISSSAADPAFPWHTARESLDKPAEKARFFAEKAVAADDQDAYLHATAAIVYLNCGDFDQAKRHADRAIALNPNEYMAIYARGMELSYGGDPEAGLVWYQKALRLDPHAPDFYLESFIECHYMRRAYQDAVKFFNQWQNPPYYMHSVLAACHAQLGNMAEAVAAVETYRAGKPKNYDPKVTFAAHLRMCKYQEDRDHWLEGYRKAGLDV